jgi:hypothetical protein
MAKLFLPRSIRTKSDVRANFSEPKTNKCVECGRPIKNGYEKCFYCFKNIKPYVRKPREPRPCVKCGEKFIPKYPVQKYCHDCSFEMNKPKRIFCRNCGKEIPYYTHEKMSRVKRQRRLCSEVCSLKYYLKVLKQRKEA